MRERHLIVPGCVRVFSLSVSARLRRQDLINVMKGMSGCLEFVTSAPHTDCRVLYHCVDFLTSCLFVSANRIAGRPPFAAA